jgi:hypothetical protein
MMRRCCAVHVPAGCFLSVRRCRVRLLLVFCRPLPREDCAGNRVTEVDEDPYLKINNKNWMLITRTGLYAVREN